MKKLFIFIIIILLFSCAEDRTEYIEVDKEYDYSTYDIITDLGQYVQINDQEVNTQELDDILQEVADCISYELNYDPIYVILKLPYFNFKIDGVSYPSYLDLDYTYPILIIPSDLSRLRHEYTHYILFLKTGDPDFEHKTKYFTNVNISGNQSGVCD